MNAALPESQPIAEISSQRNFADRLRTIRSVLLSMVVVFGLGWLFHEADKVSVYEHQAYSRDLGRLSQYDAKFNAAVLASHFGLLRDFDPINASIASIQQVSHALEKPPSFLAETDRTRLSEILLEFQRLQKQKVDAVDHYKRKISVLRNSVAYFPSATEIVLERIKNDQALSRTVSNFARQITTYALNGDSDLGAELSEQARSLLQTTASKQPVEGMLVNLLSHANIILENKSVVDTLTRSILELPTAKLSDDLTRLYAEGYERANHRAHTYRVLLFVSALGLAGYLAFAFMRLGLASQALSKANRNLEERIETLRRTQEQLHLYATVFTNAAEGMVITDSGSRIIAINPAFHRITGYRLEQLEGHTPSMLQSGQQGPEFYRDMWEMLSERGQWQGEVWNRRSSGEVYPEWLSITAVRSEDGGTSHYIGIFSDITERKEAEARIHHLAHHDTLTNLPNRLLLRDRLNRIILQPRRIDQRAAVLLLDLDRFKTINDTLGHEVGDALLIQVTDRCLGVVRKTDTFARLGGDEFVILLAELSHAQDAAQIARKILATLAQPFQLGAHALTVTGSIGIALYPDDGRNDSTLLRNADTAMYRAKDNGRDCFQFYSADMNTAALGELLLENQLRGALEQEEFLLHYQPKVDAQSGQLVGAEALLRWQHPQLGLLSPDRFIPVAEESGLIVPIGEWVLRETCRQLREWLDNGLRAVPIAVNLSARQFAQQDVVGIVRSTLAENKLPAALLELELTETMLMRDIDRTIGMLSTLSQMGVNLSIDDFGSGYSSLAYLKRFEVDVLKIDRSFVRDISPGDSQGQIAAAIIALAHNLGQKVIAEGVETEFQRDFLLNHGCDLFQGFLFSRPIPVDDFARWLAPAEPDIVADELYQTENA
ncbi:MAG: EAL domain-containing protein [Betaproteobacteria bacterium]|nr:EAL domain-containing protein [Betaproteobacteria bacterium]